MDYVSGKHPVYHLITAERRRVHRIYFQKGLEKQEQGLVTIASRKKIPFQFVEAGQLDKKAGAQVNHQGVVAESDPYPYKEVEELWDENHLLVLDEVQDPQNLGALCRSAALFDFGGIIIPETHAAAIGPGACHASVGAVEYLKIARVSSVASILEILKKKNYWVYGADGNATKSLEEENFPEKVVLVIGAEEKGLRRLVRERCDLLLKIPMNRDKTGGEIDSLNASVAGGVFLYEIFRQKIKKRRENC